MKFLENLRGCIKVGGKLGRRAQIEYARAGIDQAHRLAGEGGLITECAFQHVGKPEQRRNDGERSKQSDVGKNEGHGVRGGI